MSKKDYTQLKDASYELETAGLISGASLARESDDVDPSMNKPTSFRRFAALATTVTALAGVVAYRAHTISSVAAPIVMEEIASPDQIKLGFNVFNEYGEAKYGLEHPFIGDRFVTEPHKVATFVASGSLVDKASTLKWEFDSESSSQLSGSEVEVTFTEVGGHLVKVSAFDKAGKKVATHESEVFTAYVRRELRTLNEKDRQAFLDAASLIWKVSTKEGKKLYGKHYTGMDRFVQVHADMATGDIQCDTWHEGTGFLTHHVALSLAFESSLRAVNIAVTTPYWDFTIDGEMIKNAGGGPSMLTEVNDFFTDKWFGSVDENSHVVDGPWAHAAAVPFGDGIIHNSYGLIRAPWNNNGDTELVRHMSDVCGKEPLNKPIPSCQVHAMLINNTKLSSILMTIAGWGHGTMHVNTGGVFGECTGAMAELYSKHEELLSREVSMSSLSDEIEEKLDINPQWKDTNEFPLSDFVTDAFHLEYFHIYRTLYRSQTCAADGLAKALECPESCPIGASAADCKCKCKGVDSEDFDWKNLEPCFYMQDKTKWIAEAALSEEFRKDLVTTFCSAGVIEGEQLESASPMDIVFWMIHPILDKLVVAKRLADQPGGITMGNYGKITPLEDDSWLEFSSYSTPEYTCPGHGEDDEVLKGIPILPRVAKLADTNRDGQVSNIELYNVMDPTKFNVDYIYDDFSWSHCGSENDLDEAELNTMQTTSYASKTLQQIRNRPQADVPSFVDTRKGAKLSNGHDA